MSSTTAASRASRQMVPEKIYDALVSTRTADKVTLFFRDGRAVSGALIFNPFKGSGRVIDIVKESSVDFEIDQIRDLRLN